MKSVLGNGALVLVSLLTLVGLFELYLWVRYEREHDRLKDRYTNHEVCTRAAQDRRLIYEFVPGERCGVNSLGFMDIERSVNKPQDILRLVLIGDSVAQGQGVSRTKRFSQLLEDMWNQQHPNRPLELINLARSGYSTGQELVILQEIGLQFSPDLILWSYVLNDPAHPIFHDANGHLGRYFYRPTWRGRHYVTRALFKAQENAEAERCGKEFHVLLHCAYRDNVVTHLSQLGEISERTNIPVLFFVHPVLEQGGNFEAYAYQSIHDDLLMIAEGAGLEAVDLVKAVASKLPDELSAAAAEQRFDPWHPNAIGHQLFAEHLYQKLMHMELPKNG
ncbi:MAG: GDSL-type esterase/lipase family protein [Pseudomonadales bacterium]